jgi:hypothetical protein
VGSIGGQAEPPDPELFYQSLVNLVRVDGSKLVLSLLWVTWQHGFEFHGLSSNELFPAETTNLTIAAPPPARAIFFLSQASHHMPVYWVNDELHIFVAELLEGIFNLVC